MIETIARLTKQIEESNKYLVVELRHGISVDEKRVSQLRDDISKWESEKKKLEEELGRLKNLPPEKRQEYNSGETNKIITLLESNNKLLTDLVTVVKTEQTSTTNTQKTLALAGSATMENNLSGTLEAKNNFSATFKNSDDAALLKDLSTTLKEMKRMWKKCLKIGSERKKERNFENYFRVAFSFSLN